MELTEEIRCVLPITKSSCSFLCRKIDAVVREICFGNRHWEVIVVAHIYQGVTKNKNGWHHLSVGEFEAQDKGKTNQETRKKWLVAHFPSYEQKHASQECIYRYINVLERSLVIAVARYYYDEMKGLRVYLCFSFLFCSS